MLFIEITLLAFSATLTLSYKFLIVILAFFLEFLKPSAVLICHIFVVPGFQRKLSFQFVNFPTVEILEPRQLIPEPLIIDDHVLVLVKQVIDFKLELGNQNLFSIELILKFDEFVFELDPQLSFVIEVVFELFLGLLELLALIFEHELNFSKVMIFIKLWIYI